MRRRALIFAGLAAPVPDCTPRAPSRRAGRCVSVPMSAWSIQGWPLRCNAASPAIPGFRSRSCPSRGPAAGSPGGRGAGRRDQQCPASRAAARPARAGLRPAGDRRRRVPAGRPSAAREGRPPRAGGPRAAQAVLTGLREQALASPAPVPFLSANDGSGAHMAEQAVWRLAAIAPQAALVPGTAGRRPLDRRGAGARRLCRGGAWGLAEPGRRAARGAGRGRPAARRAGPRDAIVPLAHPAGKLFMGWLTGPRGRAVVAAQRGYRVAA